MAVTQELGLNAPAHLLMNWYFLSAAVVVLTAVTVLVTKYCTCLLYTSGAERFAHKLGILPRGDYDIVCA